MHINSLKIENLRAIDSLEITDLTKAVVIAGSNGCGKSSIFDAIRLSKSAYGQYQQNEWQLWFNEFQINVQNLAREARSVLRDPSQNMLIKAEIILSDEEKAFLRSRGPGYISQLTWNRVLRKTKSSK